MNDGGKRSASNSPARVLRFFISSTFKDMQNERNTLVQHVFPELRRRLRGAGVEAIEVDLRWGVTSEEPPLDVCLAEVDRCRPYFIGLLGDRYGARAREHHLTAWPGHEDWLGRSLTEIEIMHGVLGTTERNRGALFFERGPQWLSSLPPSEQTALADTDEEARTKLASLKARIRAAATVIDYSGPDDFAGLALEALYALVTNDLGPDQEAEPGELEDRLHAAFAHDRSRTFFGGDDAMRDIDLWASARASVPLLVRGPSGSGKSALIANWAARRRNDPNVVLIEHYASATSDASSAIPLLRRLWRRLDEELGKSGIPPSDTVGASEFGQAFAQRLVDAAAEAARRDARIILAIDGVDLAATRAQLWMPEILPVNVRLLASAADGPAADEFTAAGWQALALPPLDREALAQFVDSELARWGKKLSRADAQLILDHAPASTPLFTRILLDELRSTATHQDLARRLSLYCTAGDLSALLDQVLTRLENDHGSALVATALGAIDGCIRGAADSDIIALAGVGPLAWAKLRLELGENIRDVSGLNVMSTNALRHSARRRYFQGEATLALHKRIADHFWNMAPNDRRSQELPIQLTICGELDRLAACVADMDVLLGLQRGMGDRPGAQALLLLQQSGWDAERLVCDAFEQKVGKADTWSHQSVDYAYSVTALLAEAGFFGQRALDTAKALVDGAASVYGAEARSALVARSNYSQWLVRVGRISEARTFAEAVVSETARVLGENNPDAISALSALATIVRESGDTSAVYDLDKRIYNARKQLLGETNEETLTALFHLAQSASETGKPEEALTLAQDASAAATRRFGADHTIAIFAQQHIANLHASAGEFERAIEILVQIFKHCAEKLGPTHLTTLLIKNDLAMIMSDIGRYDTAHEFQAETAMALIERLGRDNPRTKDILANLAATKFQLGDFDGSMELETEVYEFRKRVLGADHWLTLKIMSNLSQSYMALGRFAEARPLLEAVHSGRMQVWGPAHPDTLAALGHLGLLSLKEGSTARAKELLQAAIKGYEAAVGALHPDTLRLRGCYGEALRISGELQAAEKVLEEATSDGIDVMGNDHPLTLENFGMLAHTVFDSGRVEEALKMQMHVTEARERVLGADHPRTVDAHRGIAVMRSKLKKKSWW